MDKPQGTTVAAGTDGQTPLETQVCYSPLRLIKLMTL